jgi:two-component system sensor histidine kinase AlgZ
MSIKQNPGDQTLPDFRNLGVAARVLIAANAATFLVALAAAGTWSDALDAFVRAAAILEPVLVASLTALYLASPWLVRMQFWAGGAIVLAVAIAFTAGVHALLAGIVPMDRARTLVLAGALTLALLAYLRLHTKAFSPAITEARLQALQARIRPHFLFNSLNAVLSLVRRDPKRAEHALEDLADLFRALMSDNRSLVRLADEIALLERYAALEQLRLGGRLRMSWELDHAPVDALLPPLLLQPVLENAVYHGIEPATGTGDVLVRIERRGDRVLARIENPYQPEHSHRAGNRMALANIRERLMLFFDAEARLDSRVEGDRYLVEIEIPYRTGRTQAVA